MRNSALKENALLLSKSPSGSVSVGKAGKGRIATGIKLMVCMALSILAFAAREVSILIALSAANLALAFGFKAGTVAIWREIRKVVVWQTGFITALYLLRFGAEGLLPGFRISWQLLLAFLPGIIFVQSTPHARIVETLMGVLPYKTAFVLATSIRFIPMVIGEIKSIREAQLFRGAKIAARDLIRPWHWGDLVHCLLVPVIVQSLQLSEQIARAAHARDFGLKDRRTCWPGK